MRGERYITGRAKGVGWKKEGVTQFVRHPRYGTPETGVRFSCEQDPRPRSGYYCLFTPNAPTILPSRPYSE